MPYLCEKENLMRKSLMIASTLALSIGAASAQTTPTTPATPAVTTTAASQVTTFSDVPAGHWAKDAVDVITQRGLIQGFPDGTFRGNENLTRYQAALIFYRLLQTGALSNSNLSQTDLATITRGMQEVSTELAAISSRVTDLEKLTADQQARISALEDRINALGNASTSASPDLTALTARIDALEAAVRNIPAGPQGPAGPAADTSALEARIAALEQKVNAAPATTTTTTTTGTVTTEPAPTTVVIGETPATTPTRGNLYAGVSVSATSGTCYIPNANGKQVNFCTSFGGMVGSSQIIGPFGARVAAEYKPANNAISADANATYNLNTGSSFQPYVGVGLGLTSSTSRPPGNTNTTDTYVNALVGVDYQVTDSIAAFAEGNARYYLSNKGTGALTNSSTVTDKGFVPAIKAGLKFYF
ncbi:S-layer-like protein region [Deinococcus geothermalis DSM 11300]|uniref:S-layer-like protein region n=2 Tax=Deinococcus geothermalis TaxID=68909 RepID=Q1IXZ2_DEIGD|nr:S-layer-like protein region [Deinococcus geothermalis DSM 11300]